MRRSRSVSLFSALFLSACQDEVPTLDGPSADESSEGGDDRSPNGDDTGEPAPETDADGDGYDDVAWGGVDCDDGDAAVNPGADESCDGQRNDCGDSVWSDDDGLASYQDSSAEVTSTDFTKNTSDDTYHYDANDSWGSSASFSCDSDGCDGSRRATGGRRGLMEAQTRWRRDGAMWSDPRASSRWAHNAYEGELTLAFAGSRLVSGVVVSEARRAAPEGPDAIQGALVFLRYGA